ncbi:TPA: terminase large subunit [Burkholderia vietnamiensis]|uniref:terminase large subunit n=1 Tax=Burkholderia vietnamiensis TaxID=60552 RepID=UPI002655CD88|nr:terminase TerL endonuclease subunit [Burkholderia vietnamiensis]MDN8075336.1 terminase large subunit [Burkholderia vietnamiensis]HDR8956678.1 terminase large subunit [Burkholderia vietnamiensis]HDR8982143.1 terminase large subunit [Burkholderia vietnamiensis]HDR9243251.1 terminase large subunit [Burkholderia vietnamiensis]HEP6274159.1 terminase large subunit [Burkholderia vietnamiensis]
MTFVDTANQYIDDVLAGRIVACKWVKLACERQRRDLARAEIGDADFPYRFDNDAATRICEFIELLPHTKGRWARTRQSIKLEPWQAFILTTVFGWLHVDSGLRRFRRAYEEVARKNAKSTKSSGIALYLFAADGEPGAEVYSAATTRDQAKIVFDDARAMALREPDMCAALGVEILQHQLLTDDGSKFLPLSAEGSTLDGLNVHGGVIDELHAHKTRAVFDVIDSGTGARDQSLLWLITTAGSDLTGICYEQRTHVTKILEGVFVDETFFGIIFTLDDGDDWSDPSVWIKANPNLGVSVFVDDMEMACRKAQSMPSAVNNFLTKRLNVWVNADSAWMDMRAWERCADRDMRLDDFVGERCWIGMDLAEKTDFAALVLVFERAGTFYVFPRFYLNEYAVENGSNSQYSGWERAGHIIVNEGNATDFDLIADDIRRFCGMFDVQEIPFDPAMSRYFATQLVKEGLPLVEIRQAPIFFTQPIIQTENLVLEGKLKFDGNPAMTWMVSNVVVTTSRYNGLKHPTKERPENKIDGPVAMFLALGRAMMGDESDDGVADGL